MILNIFLVGLMGSGKTTVGRALAKKLNKRFIDSDHEIEARTGASIPLIFEIEGEESFRQREAEVIRDLTAQQDIVLATGGGAILNADSRACLKSRGIVVYLHASINSILQRTSHDKNRPLLQTADPRARIEELSRQREPYYQEVAHITIETGRPNVQLLVQIILNQLELLTSAPPDSAPLNPDMSTQQPAPITLPVDLGDRSYTIAIGRSLISDAGRIAQHVAGQRVAIVTNTVVGPLYLDQLTRTLAAAGKQVIPIVLPDGEEEKNWANLMRIFDVLLAEKCDRKTTLIAL
ncbi:MAG TPA: shikimate kinase AroK, partial [Burkholderiaceae bacterium]|nr:shikimate kinase AroK [Burkholderiaceae bacterium]